MKWQLLPNLWSSKTLPESGGIHKSTRSDFEYFVSRSIGEINDYFKGVAISEQSLKTGSSDLFGFCYVCKEETRFIVAPGGETNWRETLNCKNCALINRWRSCFHLFEEICTPKEDDAVYMTEAVTPLFGLVTDRYKNTVGSEYSSDYAPGEMFLVGNKKIQMQNVTALSFKSKSFHSVLSFDVLEHVPNYQSALNEFYRVLKPKGVLLLSVPFTFTKLNLIRATIDPDGHINHLLEPEYHGDPLSTSGVLCYQIFGEELLANMLQAGFTDAYICCYTSNTWGYLGENVLFVARKA